MKNHYARDKPTVEKGFHAVESVCGGWWVAGEKFREDMNNLTKLPIFQGKMMDDFIAFAVHVISKDSPWPEEEKKKYRASIQELLGPGSSFNRDKLPEGYVPSWERGGNDVKY